LEKNKVITYGVMFVLGGILSYLFGLVPTVGISSPAILETYTDILDKASHWSNWIPIQTIGQVAGWVLTATIAYIGIKIVRLFISLISGGGGNNG